MRGSSAAHSELVNSTLLRVGALPWFRCWKQVVGTFYQVRFDELGKVSSTQAVMIGIEGMGDIAGILTRRDGAGIHTEIECKTGGAKQNEAQVRRERMVRSLGGIYLLVRPTDDPLELLERERQKGAPGGPPA